MLTLIKQESVMKKLFTRNEFENHLVESGKKLANDEGLQQKALDVLIDADKHNWIHQTKWFGEPILNLPQDLFAVQEIIFQTRPDYIIEIGVAWGGSLLFYSTLMEVLGGEKIIGVDIYVPEDLKARIVAHGNLSQRIELIVGSSLEQSTLEKIRLTIGDSRKVMVILDSFHSHGHVLAELNNYAGFVGNGYYLVVCDTIVEHLPEQKHRPRPWGPGNNPKTALGEFLKTNSRFELDEKINNKLLFTCNPGGYMRAIRD